MEGCKGAGKTGWRLPRKENLREMETMRFDLRPYEPARNH
jgi:hypothetical protein